MCSDTPTWKQLITHTLATHERISLITTIFSDHTQTEMVRHLRGNDAQAFVDSIDRVRSCTISDSKCHRAIFRRLFYTRFSLSFVALCQMLSLFSKAIPLLSTFSTCYRFKTLTTSRQYPFIVIFILTFIHSLSYETKI